MTTLIASDTLPGGKHWSMVMWRNSRLKLTDVEGGANVGMLFYNPLNLLERYNVPDTLKCQHTFKLTQDTASTRTWAASSARSSPTRPAGTTRSAATPPRRRSASKWGESSYQDDRNDWHQNGHDSFLVEAAKYGLGRRDLAANVNWFSKVVVADDGAHGRSMRAPPRPAPPSSCASRWTRSSSSTPARIR